MFGNVDFDCVVLCVACLSSVVDIAGTEWTAKYNGSNFNLISVPNAMVLDNTLVTVEIEAPSIISCSRFCGKLSRLSLYYKHSEKACYCNNDIDTRLNHEAHAAEDGTSEIMYGYIVSKVFVSTNISTFKYDIQPYQEDCFALYHHGYKTNAIYTVQPLSGDIQDTFCDMRSVLDVGAVDCLHWLQYGYKEDGVYNIRLSNGTTVRAWCDQTGGGWTVIQHRHNGSVDFYRPWAEYVNGFGDTDGEYWIGLEAIYLLAQTPSSLRIDMETFGDVTPVTAFALYKEFSLMSATDKYRLSIGNFNGSCGDSLTFHNNQRFTTFDSDNDVHSSNNCAVNSQGGWWYKSCHQSNLNGRYRGGYFSDHYRTGMGWNACWGLEYSVKTSTIKLKTL